MLIATDDYFNFFSSDFKTSFTLQDQPVYNEKITDSFLSIGYKLFHYITRCDEMDENESIIKFRTTLKTFKRGSTIKVLETANEIFNIDKTQKKGRDIWRQSSAAKLMKKMNEIYGLNIHKLKVLSSTTDNLEDIRDEKIKKGIKSCHEMGSCDELRSIVSDQGKQAA